MREVEEAKGELSHFRYSGARGSKGSHHGSALDRGAATPLPMGGRQSLAPQSPRQELFKLPASPPALHSPWERGFAVAPSVSAYPEGKRGAPGELGCRKGDCCLAHMR